MGKIKVTEMGREEREVRVEDFVVFEEKGKETRESEGEGEGRGKGGNKVVGEIEGSKGR